jgi:peptidoglycan DL-endopeptidase LytE
MWNKKLVKAGILASAICLVPSVVSAQHIVKKGDTLGGIAKHYGMSFNDILSLNKHFDDPNLINIGDHVVIRTPDKAADIIGYAKSLQDRTTYVYGGQETTGPYLKTDCSGWTQHIYSKFGINLPRTSRDQARVGKSIAFKDIQPGDLMFFSTRDDKVITHVGIAMSGDYWISNLSTKQDVTILSNWGNWTQRYFMWAQRVI